MMFLLCNYLARVDAQCHRKELCGWWVRLSLTMFYNSQPKEMSDNSFSFRCSSVSFVCSKSCVQGDEE